MNQVIRTIKVAIDNFDQENTFNIEVNGYRGKKLITASIHGDEDGFYALKESVCLKDSYTDADYAETKRLASEVPVKHGDVIIIEDKDGFQKSYRTHVNGDYSDCAVFKTL